MAADDVIPHVGIKVAPSRMVRLGMARDEAESLVRAYPGVQLDFGGDPARVVFIESPKYWGTFAGIELFEAAADDVIRDIADLLGLDQTIYCPGRHEYYFPDLNMTLWRGCISDVEDDQGFVFDSISLHSPGYYDAETLAYKRQISGLPPG